MNSCEIVGLIGAAVLIAAFSGFLGFAVGRMAKDIDAMRMRK